MCCSPWGRKQLDRTERPNNNKNNPRSACLIKTVVDSSHQFGGDFLHSVNNWNILAQLVHFPKSDNMKLIHPLIWAIIPSDYIFPKGNASTWDSVFDLTLGLTWSQTWKYDIVLLLEFTVTDSDWQFTHLDYAIMYVENHIQAMAFSVLVFQFQLCHIPSGGLEWHFEPSL